MEIYIYINRQTDRWKYKYKQTGRQKYIYKQTDRQMEICIYKQTDRQIEIYIYKQTDRQKYIYFIYIIRTWTQNRGCPKLTIPKNRFIKIFLLEYASYI